MTEALLVITIIVQVLGLSILVWKGGKYVGEVNQMIKQLFVEQLEVNIALVKHISEDSAAFKEITETMTSLRIVVAELTTELMHLRNKAD
jgi:hypothetical protein